MLGTQGVEVNCLCPQDAGIADLPQNERIGEALQAILADGGPNLSREVKAIGDIERQNLLMVRRHLNRWSAAQGNLGCLVIADGRG